MLVMPLGIHLSWWTFSPRDHHKPINHAVLLNWYGIHILFYWSFLFLNLKSFWNWECISLVCNSDILCPGKALILSGFQCLIFSSILKSIVEMCIRCSKYFICLVSKPKFSNMQYRNKCNEGYFISMNGVVEYMSVMCTLNYPSKILILYNLLLSPILTEILCWDLWNKQV